MEWFWKTNWYKNNLVSSQLSSWNFQRWLHYLVNSDWNQNLKVRMKHKASCIWHNLFCKCLFGKLESLQKNFGKQTRLYSFILKITSETMKLKITHAFYVARMLLESFAFKVIETSIVVLPGPWSKVLHLQQIIRTSLLTISLIMVLNNNLTC